ncbi:MAG: hydrolase 1, exosortase A system-associated [Pseudomonadota bacterium]
MSEEAVQIPWGQIPHSEATMLGILHRPPRPRRLGLLILVGGPQYRVGAHRQYVHLARAAAAAGFAALRFDWRGVGDSDGVYGGLPALAEDLVAAEAFLTRTLGLDGVVAWGLCEGASAILLHAPRMTHLAGAVLANPWLGDGPLEARARLVHYYGRRFLSADFWRRLIAGAVRLGEAWRESRATLSEAGRPGAASGDLASAMAAGLAALPHPALYLASEHDLVRQACDSYLANHPAWRPPMTAGRLRRVAIPGADHVFASEAWRQAVAGATVGYLEEVARAMPSG